MFRISIVCDRYVLKYAYLNHGNICYCNPGNHKIDIVFYDFEVAHECFEHAIEDMKYSIFGLNYNISFEEKEDVMSFFWTEKFRTIHQEIECLSYI